MSGIYIFYRRTRIALILFTISAFSACIAEQEVPVLMHVPEEIQTFLLDFSYYTEKGFLFTPRSYSGKYNSIGVLEFKYNVEAEMVVKNLNEVSEEARKSGVKTITYYDWEVAEIDYQVILDHAYRKACAMGGNAMINFKLEVKHEEYENAPEYPGVIVPVVYVSGFVIQRYYPYHTEPLPVEPTE